MSNIYNRVFRNNITAILTAGINASATSLTVQSGQGAGFALESGQHIRATLAQGTTIEIINVTGRSGDNLTIQRGQEGTTQASFSAGATISIRWTADTIDKIVDILKQLSPDVSGSVWVNEIWQRMTVTNWLADFTLLNVLTANQNYVSDAFILEPGDYVEIFTDQKIEILAPITETSKPLTLVFADDDGEEFAWGLHGQSTSTSAITGSSMQIFEKNFDTYQQGGQWVAKMEITQEMLTQERSGFQYVDTTKLRLTRVFTGSNRTNNPSTYTLYDIKTSKGSLQPGALASSQAMIVHGLT